jgi:hypothetical protein
LYTRNVDFRLHATYAMFSFVGASCSNARMGWGGAYGSDIVRTLQGQLIGSWRMLWNDRNARMYRRVMRLLDTVYDVLSRPFGPPPIIIAILVHGGAENHHAGNVDAEE